MTASAHRRPAHPRGQRGLSLVELMVGVTVGLFIVAAAAMLMGNQLGDNRRLLLETQLQQDLRATMDIVTRQMRRAATTSKSTAGQGLHAAWNMVVENLYQTVTLSGGPPADGIEFSFYLTADNQGDFGFRLQDGVVKTQVAEGNWQDLTDSNAIVVRSLTFTPEVTESEKLPCPNLCADGSQDCWPTVWLRSYVVEIVARAKNGMADGDPAVERRITSRVRVRNDRVAFNDPTFPSRVCPLP